MGVGGGVSIEIDIAGLGDIFSDEDLESAQLQFVEGCRAVMEPFVPKRTGNLRDNTQIGRDEITYTEEYAADVYFAPEGRQWTTEGTGPYWDEQAKALKMGDIEGLALDCLGVER